MINLNKMYLIGTIGQDVELKNLPSGKVLSKFSLAVSDGYKDKEGQWVNKTTWFTIVCFKDLSNLAKGDRVHIDGSMNVREWEDKEGKKQKSYEVNALIVTKLVPVDQIIKKTSSNPVQEEEFKGFDDDCIPF